MVAGWTGTLCVGMRSTGNVTLNLLNLHVRLDQRNLVACNYVFFLQFCLQHPVCLFVSLNAFGAFVMLFFNCY